MKTVAILALTGAILGSSCDSPNKFNKGDCIQHELLVDKGPDAPVSTKVLHVRDHYYWVKRTYVLMGWFHGTVLEIQGFHHDSKYVKVKCPRYGNVKNINKREDQR